MKILPGTGFNRIVTLDNALRIVKRLVIEGHVVTIEREFGNTGFYRIEFKPCDNRQ